MATPKKKTSTTNQTAREHQKSLVDISGSTASANEWARQKKVGKANYEKTGKTWKGDAQKLTDVRNAAQDKTQASFGKPEKVTPYAAPVRVAKKNAAEKMIQNITNRYRVTAREARDIVTAVGSAAQAVRKSPQEGLPVKKIVKDVAKQVKEVGTAATSGKKGTTAATVKPNKSSQNARKGSGSGYVTYKTTGSKKR